MEIGVTEVVFRLIPLLLVLGTAVMGLIVCLNNITAPGANLRFVEHIMTMDTTNMDSGTQWREIRSPVLHRAAFLAILVCEAGVTVLGLVGSYFLAANLTAPADAWDAAKLFGYLTFLMALVVWFLIIQVVGAEWYVRLAVGEVERNPRLHPHQPDHHRRDHPPPDLVSSSQ